MTLEREQQSTSPKNSPTPSERTLSNMPRASSRNDLSEDFDARRLENAVWRMRCATPTIAKVGSAGDLSDQFFLRKVQDTIGECVEFPTIHFPQGDRTCKYDDLPTFPLRPNFANFKNNLRPASECVVFDGCPEDPYHPSNTPIYQTATFVQPSANEFGAYDYTRSGNPTRTALEKHVAMLEQAAASFAFASGMAALQAVTRLLRAGDEILCNEDIYGGMHRLLSQDVAHNGVQVTFVDTTDIDSVAKAITSKTKIIHTESPSNPRMRISDLRSLAELAHRHDILLSVDSTMMPPVICKPLTLGADIVTHSATKFFSGHADCTGGLVSVKSPQLAQRIAFLQNAQGTALAPFECFLFLRGIKTMFLRVERAQANATVVANFLLRHPCVKQVLFPVRGACDAKSLAIHQSQCNGVGSVISFSTGSVEFSRRLLDASRIFKTTVSFGSVNSLGEMPCTMSHASIPAEKRTLAEDLIRLSIGIEDVQDLIADLQKAFELAEGDFPVERNDGYNSKFEDLPVVPRIPKCVVNQLVSKTMSNVSTCLPSPSPGPSSDQGSTESTAEPGFEKSGDNVRHLARESAQPVSGSGSFARDAAIPWGLALLGGTAVFLTWRCRFNAAGLR